MSVEQKCAWLIVGCFALALVGFLVLVPLIGVKAAVSAFGLFGFGGLGPLLFRKKRMPAEVAMDERDRMIAEKATLGGGMSSYMVFILACMIPWFVYMFQGKKTISIHVLPLVVFCGGITFFVVRSVVILILYGREANHAED